MNKSQQFLDILPCRTAMNGKELERLNPKLTCTKHFDNWSFVAKSAWDTQKKKDKEWWLLERKMQHSSWQPFHIPERAAVALEDTCTLVHHWSWRGSTCPRLTITPWVVLSTVPQTFLVWVGERAGMVEKSGKRSELSLQVLKEETSQQLKLHHVFSGCSFKIPSTFVLSGKT